MSTTYDLGRFIADNKRLHAEGKRPAWESRVDLIREQFPSTRDPDWNVILRDDDAFARLLKDILKVDQMEPGQKGPRPNLNRERGMQTWKEMTGRDYSERPFLVAYQSLVGRDSLRIVARKTGMAKSKVERLRKGDLMPSIEDLRMIAKGYGKQPAYFAEYRAEYITAAVAARLENEAEMTVEIYTKLMRAS